VKDLRRGARRRLGRRFLKMLRTLGHHFSFICEMKQCDVFLQSVALGVPNLENLISTGVMYPGRRTDYYVCSGMYVGTSSRQCLREAFSRFRAYRKYLEATGTGIQKGTKR
jgi:hypothetical protein